MTGKCFESVWDAIADTPQEAENMKLRSALLMELRRYLDESGLSQSEAAKLFGVTQPRVSDLVRGKIDRFALDTLVNMLASAGMHVEMRIAKTARRSAPLNGLSCEKPSPIIPNSTADPFMNSVSNINRLGLGGSK